jgi:hypothetical protein
MIKLLSKITLTIISTLGFVSGANAKLIKYEDFSDLSGITTNGHINRFHEEPIFYNGQNVLRLTNATHQGSHAFFNDSLNIEENTSFSTSFAFQIHTPDGKVDASDDIQGGDGFMFVMQSDGASIGDINNRLVTKSNMSFGSIRNGFGVEFDTYENRNNYQDESGNHLGIDVATEDGVGSVISKTQQEVTEGHLNNGNDWYAWIDYDGITNMLDVRVSQSDQRSTLPLLSYEIDIMDIIEPEEEIYVGFTASTGWASNEHDIRDFEFETYVVDAVDAYEPSTLLLLAGGLFGLFGFRNSKTTYTV